MCLCIFVCAFVYACTFCVRLRIFVSVLVRSVCACVYLSVLTYFYVRLRVFMSVVVHFCACAFLSEFACI